MKAINKGDLFYGNILVNCSSYINQFSIKKINKYKNKLVLLSQKLNTD